MGTCRAEEHQLTHFTGAYILIAEDNPEDVYLVRESLRESGVQARIQVVSDGENAIKQVLHGEECPALILLDAHLPKKNGIEVLRAIRSSMAGKDIPVVMCTSEMSEHEQSDVLALGVSAYFSKSANLAEYSRIGALAKKLLKQAAAKGQSGNT